MLPLADDYSVTVESRLPAEVARMGILVRPMAPYKYQMGSFHMTWRDDTGTLHASASPASPPRRPPAGAESVSLALRPVAHTLGELAFLLGRDDEAAARFAQAAAIADRWNAPTGPPTPEPTPLQPSAPKPATNAGSVSILRFACSAGRTSSGGVGGGATRQADLDFSSLKMVFMCSAPVVMTGRSSCR
ncbi:hypothetical protein BKA00_003180 [Actinomadura coerulea]|uniref:Uncharacterized protein n=1 Tax=Actinomadura coerulea TaxID=46159 RepID=A0A7X0G0P6_9ACTN|nr:hypothetical protein [Actinomadura coerulea]MBB6396266.1 hypothetical protein [Actinomadura coerulea]GGQ39181.1 hypothetical protein GCM10010187_66530 [Actinomadura coerulea]